MYKARSAAQAKTENSLRRSVKNIAGGGLNSHKYVNVFGSQRREALCSWGKSKVKES